MPWAGDAGAGRVAQEVWGWTGSVAWSERRVSMGGLPGQIADATITCRDLGIGSAADEASKPRESASSRAASGH